MEAENAQESRRQDHGTNLVFSPARGIRQQWRDVLQGSLGRRAIEAHPGGSAGTEYV